MNQKGPLDGVKVTDFTWIGAGSFTTKILADLGADVVKLESATRPDTLRMMPPFKDKISGVNRSAAFGTSTASLMLVVTISAVAVMPGRSERSELSTSSTVS